jgi:hypothetical protein
MAIAENNESGSRFRALALKSIEIGRQSGGVMKIINGSASYHRHQSIEHQRQRTAAKRRETGVMRQANNANGVVINNRKSSACETKSKWPENETAMASAWQKSAKPIEKSKIMAAAKNINGNRSVRRHQWRKLKKMAA